MGDEDIAVSREQILSELLDGTGDWSNRVRAITTRYSVSRRTVYRWLSRYHDGAVMSSLIPRKRGIAWALLPLEYRQLQRGGIQLFNIHYWSDVLPTLVKRDDPFLVHYDPRDLSRIYVKAPDHSYVEVPYADIRRPPISVGKCVRLVDSWLSEARPAATRNGYSGRMTNLPGSPPRR